MCWCVCVCWCVELNKLQNVRCNIKIKVVYFTTLDVWHGIPVNYVER